MSKLLSLESGILRLSLTSEWVWLASQQYMLSQGSSPARYFSNKRGRLGTNEKDQKKC